MSAIVRLSEQIESGGLMAPEQVREAASILLDADAAAEGKARFLSALAVRGETPDEIAGFVSAFLEHAVDPGLDANSINGPLIDVCGTGGDKLGLFNVSTTAMFVVAAGGVCVVKHGNRGITSKSGGADVLEALGIRIDLPPARFVECVKQTGIGFMLAPQYHPAFKAVAPVRKILAKRGQRSLFNLIGPLLNPVRPEFQLIGAFDPALPETFVRILGKLGRNRAWSVCGETGDGRRMDEFSTLGPNLVAMLEDDGTRIRTESIDPADDLGIDPPEKGLEELLGGGAAENAATLEGVIDSGIRDGRRDLVLLNAAAAFAVADAVPDLEAGVAWAADLIDSGSARRKLDELQDFNEAPVP